MIIRPFTPGDASALAEIYHLAVRQIGRRYYSQAQVEAWSPAPVTPERFIQRVSDGRSVFVAEMEAPVGFIELESDGHIDCFYCSPTVVGAGVGSALYEHLEAAARTAGHTRLFVEASEPARIFFERKGFALIARQEFELRGVAIHNFRMEKAW